MKLVLNDRILGIIAVLIASILWGTTGTVATFAPDVSAVAMGAAAMAGGGLLQALLASRGIIQAKSQLYQQCHYLICGAIMVALYPLAFYASMRLSGVTIGTVISIGSAPLFSALIEYLFDKSSVSKRWLVAALIGLLGIALLCFSESSSMHEQGAPNNIIWGVILALFAGFSYATYSWTARKMMQNGIASRIAMGTTFGLGAILLLPVLCLTITPLISSWHNASIGLYMATIPMFLGYVCFGFALARIAASLAITITLLEPIVAAILAVLVVGEKLTELGWFGTFLVLLCLILITLPNNKVAHR